MRYICIEGTEGCYKTTNVSALVEYFKSQGKTVLQTKEPGTPLNTLTMKLREIMLSNEFANDMTPIAREFISQAIRSIHMEKVVIPNSDVDFIIQDRGTLSGLTYAKTIGHDDAFIRSLISKVTNSDTWNIYDDVIILMNDPEVGLTLAKSSKNEFKGGDVMESMGNQFMNNVLSEMIKETSLHINVHLINVCGKNPTEILQEILKSLDNRKHLW
jgi:dTMP kinase